MSKLLIATTNPSKLQEAVSILGGNFEVLSLKDFENIKSVEETGKTFEENAVLKAKGYFAQTGVPCVADDGGLIVDYLGGAPGVSSHRWLGRQATDQELAEAIIEKMAGVPFHQRKARIGGFLVFWDGRNLLKKENWTEGYISERLQGEVRPGFPYRPVMVVAQFDKPYAFLTSEEHEKVNARRKNLKELIREIKRLGY
ncbi:hypothetical protein A2833_03140 [Candidatus Azambacteria bacterium RIFCSPHIGHO2_01_FULL_44_55]|uniref:Non-canonical purine NTP pyrophosphatase n=1 Tax=Candidatus Azambacteria bacterium RIFCSPLOWO2_02_FULL_44_14 TaxID=1797306 RepID=A0A1F5CBF2_9BACT|nr:MAG: hypothetical protein A3A18_02455 [Candidatus Azambacteria bacterium RIFCSPLOWO2_01_FULL_44_84]OGD32726.1 MAG: hypothetical protein A3C78_01870 [Candidatus Azambacteria bacterium RIFCSPHIGHO2_02_FULL_45_18]OGD40179.1 MAG: hypothetical protein A3I30_02835 [Candidatus Azambacteria bacterium RIFCSPLOWO2_02_FULL_44_14]OGD41711.1 MAG: hypothetical protein A2833_03140 [Candidatus Azambacteria bacterium RIFCSPHIGHO2_01_FULL_44_55]OGD50070.1 MAG: hypothetical protein A2608_03415 [Candidatus Azam